METIVGAVIGGLLTILGAVAGTYVARRHETRKQHDERQRQLATGALAALQGLVRATIDIAYIELPPRSLAHADTPSQAEARRAFEVAVTAWNQAMYAVLVGCDPTIGRQARELDEEIDRLAGLALRRRWERIQFRDERRKLGTMMAEFIDAVRASVDLPTTGLGSVWTWDDTN